MTDEEAMEKRCPIEKANCRGAGCMMWRWDRNAQYPEQEKSLTYKKHHIGEGYCTFAVPEE